MKSNNLTGQRTSQDEGEDLKTYVENVIKELELAVSSDVAGLWAETFVKRKMEFHRLHGRGLITSIVHGADFFQNVLDCLNGKQWKEEGEYGNNFRKLIKSELTKSGSLI